MAHDKVYAICENMCMEETMTKEQIEEAFGDSITVDGQNSVVIKGAASDEIKSLVIEGKGNQKTSKQDKNLIGLKKGFTQTVNGMTVSVQDDGSLRVTGTPTKISESYIPLEGASSISNGDYTLSVKTIGSTPSNACRLLKTNPASAANSFKSTVLSCQSNTTKSISATITDEEVYTYFYFYTNANVSIDATIYPQLEKGSTYTEWGEFTPDSPSPDYPSTKIYL